MGTELIKLITEISIDFITDNIFKPGWIACLNMIIDEINSILLMDVSSISMNYDLVASDKIQSLSSSIFMPIGVCILCFYLTLEFINVLSRHESISSPATVEMPMKIIFKFVLSFLTFGNINVILSKALDFFNGVVNLAGKILVYDGNLVSLHTIENVNLTGYTFLEMVFLIILTYLVYLLVVVASWIVKIIFISRHFEIIILMLLAPIPFATLVSSEHHADAIRFMKTFMAVLLQGVVIYLIVGLWKAMFDLFFVGVGEPFDILGDIAIYTIVLAMAVMQSGRLTKEGISAM